MHNRSIPTRSLAAGALTGLAAFPIMVLALNLIQRHSYHPTTEAVSELALGRDGWLMAIAFSSFATGMLCLAIVLRRTVANATVAPALLTTCSVLTYVSAVFHADGGNKTTRHGEIHQTAGIITFILMIIAMFILSHRFNRDPTWHRLARPTLIWAICAVAAFFLIPTLSDNYFGLAQRIFITTWLTWLITTATYARHFVATPRQPATTNTTSRAARA
jgi:hypothetical membrane protein